ncbi:uncharacterized protein K441DRAFT_653690 [Cenococcum geophilum 1.58]|uniref:uncharacterized protein n=1 Tax=Cenococcum geophilum 1.58 TaxID=794803 RepID=UPI00358F5B26|nr:hypothetical protein K441DRAFT_653690 [Cenococcum geophilum 1.58]
MSRWVANTLITSPAGPIEAYVYRFPQVTYLPPVHTGNAAPPCQKLALRVLTKLSTPLLTQKSTPKITSSTLTSTTPTYDHKAGKIDFVTGAEDLNRVNLTDGRRRQGEANKIIYNSIGDDRQEEMRAIIKAYDI